MMLDTIDKQIIQILQNDARISNRNLASRVGLSPSSCLVRVRKLETQEVISGYHARINFAAVGLGVQALISIRLGVHNQTVAESFFDFAGSLAEVIQVFHVTGDEDYLIHVAAKSSDHLREIVLTSFAGRAEVVHIETSLVFGYSASDLAELY